MKTWMGFGSEHSANLVMIGLFQDVGDAKQAKMVIDRLTEHVEAEIDAGQIVLGEITDRYSDKSLDVLRQLRVPSMGPDELEQFAYDVDVRSDDARIVITTEEIEVSAFLKVLIENGARVEVYSAHDYPDTGYGRGG